MKSETKNTNESVNEQLENMIELHDAELDSVAGAMMSGCPKWPNTSQSWGF